MGIFLLSETNQLDTSLKRVLVDTITERGNRIAYISSTPQNSDREYFAVTVQDYQNINSSIQLDYFDLSDDFDNESLQNLSSYGVIHLSGGNTYIFLEALRRRNMKHIFQSHIKNNGLIIGVSAGAIALTPHIGTSELCGDINIPVLKELDGMSLVDFCFVPHLGSIFDSSEENIAQAHEYAATVGKVLYLVRDQDGIYVDENQLIFYGDILKFTP